MAEEEARERNAGLENRRAVSERRFELMKQQCQGSIRGSVCIQADGAYVLGPEGKLVPAKSGWNPTVGGAGVFFDK